ncbi:MAG: hypothetical protein KBS83_00545 [Lachnospiraceae bacterium]|nr:hypothetical protein [Candidatus Equihabitans merdae]
MQDSKNKKSLMVRLLVFVLILVVILSGMSAMLSRKVMLDDSVVPVSEKPLINVLKEPENSIDLIVLGNSLSFTSIEPKQMEEAYGLNTWHCGQPGQSIQQAYHSLEELLEVQTPQVVLVETNMMFDDIFGVNSWKKSFDTWLRYHFAFFHFHDLWKSYLLGKTYEQNSYHGYQERTGVKPYEAGFYMTPSEDKASFRNNSCYYMSEMKKLCDEKGIRFVMYSCPSPVHFNYSYHNALTDWSNDQGIEYVDLNNLLDDVGINWQEDTMDGGDHVNQNGARKVTDYMGRYLTK